MGIQHLWLGWYFDFTTTLYLVLGFVIFLGLDLQCLHVELVDRVVRRGGWISYNSSNTCSINMLRRRGLEDVRRWREIGLSR